MNSAELVDAYLEVLPRLAGYALAVDLVLTPLLVGLVVWLRKRRTA